MYGIMKIKERLEMTSIMNVSHVCAHPIAWPVQLTPYQWLAVTTFIDTGGSITDTANRLCIQPRTVRMHLYNARTALGLRNTIELVRWVFAHTSIGDVGGDR